MKNLVNSPNFGILVFRVFIGLTMAIAHGMGKIPPPEGFAARLGEMGFPLPMLFAWAAALSEFAGGLFIAAGLFTRHAAFFLGFTMFVAAFVAHGGDPFDKKELSLMFLAACVVLFFQGAGKYSLDRLFRKK